MISSSSSDDDEGIKNSYRLEVILVGLCLVNEQKVAKMRFAVNFSSPSLSATTDTHSNHSLMDIKIHGRERRLANDQLEMEIGFC